MRLRLLFALGLLAGLAAGPARAQLVWTGALKIGGTVTSFDGDTISGDTDWEPRAGLAAGAAVGLDLGGPFSPMLEFLYVRKGAAADALLADIPIRIRSELTYLQVPLLLLYRLETNGYVHPKVFAGPMVAYRLDSRFTFRFRDDDVTQTEEDTSVENVDFGVVAGAGVELDISDQRLTVEARLSLGLADITRPDEDRDPTLRNRGVEFLIGFVF